MAKLFLKESINQGIRRFKQYSGQGAQNAIEECAKHLLKEANHLIPIDTGAMIASGKAGRLPGTNGIDSEGYVTYDTPYVVWVHEDLTKNHGAAFNIAYAHEIAAGITHARRPQEQAKFLEIPATDPTVHKKLMEIAKDEMMKELAKI